jgi:hypothetical protein
MLTPGRRRRLPLPRSLPAPALVGLLALLAGGCAGPNPFLARRTTVGALKGSVSRLEFENEQLRREVADARSDHQRLANDLEEAESRNGELAARLDDARNLISQQGSDLRDSSDLGRSEPAPPTTRRTSPGPSRRPYRPPFTQIRGQVEVPVPDEIEEDDSSAVDRVAPLRPSRRRDDPDAQSRRDSASPWLPVASGASMPTATARR